MIYDIQIREVTEQTTAVVRYRARGSELADVVPRGCGEVWAFMRSSGLPRPGRNLALYLDGEINIEVGVEVFQAFEGNERIICSNTPAGVVATTAHFGPYDRLGEAHAAIHKYCSEHGHVLAGPDWELYGHWTDNPAELRTDIFYLLRHE
jgi:effector-binding domain-containing protein